MRCPYGSLEEGERGDFPGLTDVVPLSPPLEEEEALLACFFQDQAAPSTPAEEVIDPLSMTRLQQLAAVDKGPLGAVRGETWRCRWLDRSRVRRSERIILHVAVTVSVVLITGAFAFVRMEDSSVTDRDASDRRWLEARQERTLLLQAQTEEAVAAAGEALSQPRWTGMLSHIKDARRLLPEIRDHYALYAYAPFHDPDLRAVQVVEDEKGVAQVWVQVDGGRPWASTILMHRVGDIFKLDWQSFQDRFLHETLRAERETSEMVVPSLFEDSLLEGTRPRQTGDRAASEGGPWHYGVASWLGTPEFK